MRCKKHITDLSSSVGVCASCLRERLFSLITAQAQAQAQQAEEDRRKSDAHPPPLVFPRSVSPYISHRKSDSSDWNNHLQHSLSVHRFYSTPQIGTGNLYTKQKSRFSFFSRFFRSKSKNPNSDPIVSAPNSRNSCTAATTSSPSWFSTKLSGHQKKQSRMFSHHELAAGFERRTVPNLNRDRGMSPARVSDCGDVADFYDVSSGYSSESSQGWRQTPLRGGQPVRRGGGRPNQARNVTGLKFCLSPMVRASPNRNWSQKGMPPEMAFCGEIRVPAKPHLSSAASSCANRSRKLADFGRFNHNH